MPVVRVRVRVRVRYLCLGTESPSQRMGGNTVNYDTSDTASRAALSPPNYTHPLIHAKQPQCLHPTLRNSVS